MRKRSGAEGASKLLTGDKRGGGETRTYMRIQERMAEEEWRDQNIHEGTGENGRGGEPRRAKKEVEESQEEARRVLEKEM